MEVILAFARKELPSFVIVGSPRTKKVEVVGTSEAENIRRFGVEVRSFMEPGLIQNV